MAPPIRSLVLTSETGYIGSVSFFSIVLEVVNKLRSVNPKLIYVCDPVMGDEGKLYVPPELVSVYRQKVVPVASMLTPNQFEAELLTNSRFESEKDGREACNILHAAGPSMVVVTSININGNLLRIGSHQKEKGTGDPTTALLLWWSNVISFNCILVVIQCLFPSCQYSSEIILLQ